MEVSKTSEGANLTFKGVDMLDVVALYHSEHCSKLGQ